MNCFAFKNLRVLFLRNSISFGLKFIVSYLVRLPYARIYDRYLTYVFLFNETERLIKEQS